MVLCVRVIKFRLIELYLNIGFDQGFIVVVLRISSCIPW